MRHDIWFPDFEVAVVEETGQEWPRAYLVSKWESNEIGERRFTGETRTYIPAADPAADSPATTTHDPEHD